MERFEQWINTIIIHNSDDGRTHTWPSVASVVRFTGLATTALHLLEVAESTAVQAEDEYDDEEEDGDY